jgi:prepilin-type N-terminal cleavage/methylation domain-containing protein
MARRNDKGFTLIELLVVIAIMGIIAVPLGNVVIGYLHNADATTARLSESHDAQIAAAYFAQDVSSVGVHDFTDTTYPLEQSIEQDAPPTSGLFPCGSATLPNAVVRMAWDDFSSGAAADPTEMRVAYVVESSSGNTELHRITCAGSATPTSDTVMAHYVVSASVACSSTCTGSGASLPQMVTLTLTIHAPGNNASGNYVVALNGQRRQT